MAPKAHSAPQAQSADDSPLLTTKEAARYLKLPHRTLEQWRVEGKGPRHVKQGRRVHYRRTALEAWITQQERSRTGQASNPAA